MKGKNTRDADLIDLVGLPRRDLPAEVEALKLPRRGMASVLNPVVPASPVIDPTATGSTPDAPQPPLPPSASEQPLPPKPRPEAAIAPKRERTARPIPVATAAPDASRPRPSSKATLATPQAWSQAVAGIPPVVPAPRAMPQPAPAAPVPPKVARLPEPQEEMPAPATDAAPAWTPALTALPTMPETSLPAPPIQPASPITPHSEPLTQPVAVAPVRQPVRQTARAPMPPDPVPTAAIAPSVKTLAPQAPVQPAMFGPRGYGVVAEDYFVSEEPPARVFETQKKRTMSKEWELPRARRTSERAAPDQPAAAAGLTIPATKINYIVRQQPLDQVLREIGQMVGVRVITGSGVRASVRDRQIDGPANAAFDRLAREFGLFWFSDGSVVYVDPVEDNKTKFFRVKNTSSSAIENTLDAAGLGKHRDRVKVVGNDGLVRATGPESFLKIVETMLTGIETDKGSVQIIRFGQKTN